MPRRVKISFLIFLQFVAINILMAQSASSYAELISSGDAYLAKKEYYNAKTSYQLASQLDEIAEYPKNKIEEIIKILDAELELRIVYEDKMLLAEEAYVEKDYELAISLYKAASKIIDYEYKPKTEILRIEKERETLKNNRIAFEQLILDAGKAKVAEDYLLAISKLKEANEFFPEQSNLIIEIAQLNLKLKQKDARNVKFKELIAIADRRMKQNLFQDALHDYQDALVINKEDSYVLSQIELANEAIIKEQAYDKAIERADSYYVGLEFEAAKKAYENAKSIWPEKAYPENMLVKIEEGEMRNASSLDLKTKKYNLHIQEGDANFNNEAFESAIGSYRSALELFPQKSYPSDQIAAITSQMKSKDEYNQLIKDGDIKYGDAMFNEALFDYYKALTISPKANYPQERINEIDEILKLKATEEDNYAKYIQLADSLYDLSELHLSILNYKKALAIKNGEPYPTKRLKEAEELLADKTKLDDSYNEAVSNGDSFFDASKYSQAMDAYRLANRIKPEEQYPLYKMEDINTIVEQHDIRVVNDRFQKLIESADQLYASQSFRLALEKYESAAILKPNEIYPPQQIDKIKQLFAQEEVLNSQFDRIIKSADSLFYLNEFDLALNKYIEAKDIKPLEKYPPEQIEKINQIFASIRDLDSNYLRYIETADSLFTLQSWSNAKPFYIEAKNLKPLESYPPEQIEKINQILAEKESQDGKYNQLIRLADSLFYLEVLEDARFNYMAALNIRPLEKYPPEQINKIDKRISEISDNNRNYQLAISKGDLNFDQQSYLDAKKDYNLALSYKANEEYPKKRLLEIDDIISKIDALNLEYQNAIQNGDRKLREEQYKDALLEFEAALRLKEEEAYPKERIQYIQTILADLESFERSYLLAIQLGDSLLINKLFDVAIVHYKEAQKMKPRENYPPAQIKYINELIEELTLEENYFKALTEADQLFEQKKYSSSLTPYKMANQLKPNEEYPLAQIAKIKDLLDADERAYQNYIQLGDKAFQLRNYEDAIFAFESALNLFPNEVYPRLILDKIDTILRRELVVTLVQMPEIIVAGEEKKFSFDAIDYRDRQDNYILLEMKVSSEDKVRVFINFGKDDTKNGGYALILNPQDKFTKYFVRINRQIRWQNEENNWVSILPESGDIEVKTIQISREDKGNN